MAMRPRKAMLSMRTRMPSAQGFMYAQIMPWIHTYRSSDDRKYHSAQQHSRLAVMQCLSRD